MALNILPTEAESPAVPQVPEYSEIPPKEYLLGIAKRLKTENESERSKINAQQIIQMCRRHRNQTPSDAFGYWKNGVWCESAAFATLHNVPIFQQLVVGAESNFLQADIRLDIKANTQEFENRSVEKIAKDIYEVLNERQWTEMVRSEAFYASILKNNAFYISRFNKDKGDDIPVPKFDNVKYQMGGVQQCTNCYQASDMDASSCPDCGNDSFSITDEPQTVEDQLVSMFDLAKTGEVELAIADGLDASVDPNGKPSDIRSCKWVEWRVLAQKEELKRLYPHLKLDGTPKWSYQTRLKKALIRFKSGEEGPTTESDKTEFEMRYIWLDLAECEGYIAPAPLKLGEQMILDRGEKLADKYPDGLVIGVVDQELAFIDGEEKYIAASHWISDGTSFEGLGAKAGLAIQRKINQLENIAMEGETRSLKGAMLYNSEAIDGNHLEGANTNIPLKQDFAMQLGQKVSELIAPLNVEGLSPNTLLYMQEQKQTMQEVMGIPDVVLGQDTAEDKTFGGQALRSRNALGLLTPKTQSTARAKELWLGHQLKLIQKFYSPESLKQFGARSGNEWLDDEVQAFFQADIEKAISISYIEGTEVPESRYDKQQRLRMDIGAGFIPLTPELQAQLANESNYDAPDINNYDSNLRLFEKRFRFVSEVAPQADRAFQQYDQMLQSMPPQIDPMTGSTGRATTKSYPDADHVGA
jgi:hypothetical protein